MPVVDHFGGPYRAGCSLRKEEDEPLACQAILWTRWVFLCSIDDNRTLLEFYFLTDLWPCQSKWTAILKLCLEHDSLMANKRACFFLFTECMHNEEEMCFPYEQCPPDWEPCYNYDCGHPDYGCCCQGGWYEFLARSYLFYLLICQYFFRPILFSYFLNRWTGSLLREKERWETKHFMGMAYSRARATRRLLKTSSTSRNNKHWLNLPCILFS